MAHNVLDVGARAEAAQDLSHFHLKTGAEQVTELIVHILSLFLLVVLALQRLEAHCGRAHVMTIIAVETTRDARVAAGPLAITLQTVSFSDLGLFSNSASHKNTASRNEHSRS